MKRASSAASIRYSGQCLFQAEFMDFGDWMPAGAIGFPPAGVRAGHRMPRRRIE